MFFIAMTLNTLAALLAVFLVKLRRGAFMPGRREVTPATRELGSKVPEAK